MNSNLRASIWVFTTLVGYTILCLSLFLMLRTILNYTSFQDNIQFLALKQAYIHILPWKLAFYIHIFSAFLALAAGFTQFSTEIRQHHPRWHRLLGHLYVWNILVVNFPTALLLAIYANGGLPGKLPFLLLDLLWVGFTFKALQAAIQKKFTDHQNFMIRSYALTFSAITLRTWKIILVQYALVLPQNLYLTEAWLGFVPNLVLAEAIVYYVKKRNGFLTTKRNSAGKQHP